MPAAEALRQARLTVLSEAVASCDKPYYWAGWALSGDPGIRGERGLAGQPQAQP
jgi:CHAT domain-containing protein